MLPRDPHNPWELQLCPLRGKLRHWEPSASRAGAVSMSPRSQHIVSRWPLHHPRPSPSSPEQPFSSEPADISFPQPLISLPSGSMWLARGALVAVTQLLVTFCTHSVTPRQLQLQQLLPHLLWPPQRCPSRSPSVTAVTVSQCHIPLQGCLYPRDAPTRTGSGSMGYT